MNWLLSKDGQTAFCNTLKLPSNRINVFVDGAGRIEVVYSALSPSGRR